ncbi:MAG: hypothetical protein Fur0022_15580 [Anaerolineales bacterium]
MNTPTIKTIEMPRAIREQNSQRLSGKSHKERIEYYRQQAQKMEKKISILRKTKERLHAPLKAPTDELNSE